ncbi:hypothetical protein [Streptomyces sp. NPDC093707]|uniref:hypothetical protein n=1 Tax=Streptomyces sp. NPDC093707 TaxID=3154984 RepID=UPI00344EA86F
MTAKLALLQENAAVGHYGDGGLYSFTLDLHPVPNHDAKVDEKDVPHTFVTPTGWKWVKYADTYYYDPVKQETHEGGRINDLKISADGKTLTFSREVHINSNTTDHGYLCYNLAIAPDEDADAGVKEDGTASVGPKDGSLAKPIHVYGIIDK